MKWRESHKWKGHGTKWFLNLHIIRSLIFLVLFWRQIQCSALWYSLVHAWHSLHPAWITKESISLCKCRKGWSWQIFPIDIFFLYPFFLIRLSLYIRLAWSCHEIFYNPHEWTPDHIFFGVWQFIWFLASFKRPRTSCIQIIFSSHFGILDLSIVTHLFHNIDRYCSIRTGKTLENHSSDQT